MSFILDEANRIAHLFDYPAEQVHRGVAKYIHQMGEGLTQENTTLSQIPTFVTSVPNGTEKVFFLFFLYEVSSLNPANPEIFYRAFTSPSTSVAPISVCARLTFMAIRHSPSRSPRLWFLAS